MINIYEVIAIDDGLPLFFEEHVNRLYISIKNYIKIDKQELRIKSLEVVKTQLKSRSNGNIKLIFNTKKKTLISNLIKPRKPKAEDYIIGAKIDIIKAERINPLIKQENITFRESCDEFCKKNNLYDVLLCNNKNFITEGSRSNFLLINKEGQILTSPIGDALNGITRDKIFKLCRFNNIQIIEMNITKEIINKSDSLLITGTSPEILPIINCGDIHFKVKNTIIDTLISGFKKLKSDDKIVARELFS